MRFDFTSDMYYRYRLYRLDHIGDAVLFFPLNVNMALRSHLYEHLDVDIARLEDKRISIASAPRTVCRSPPPSPSSRTALHARGLKEVNEWCSRGAIYSVNRPTPLAAKVQRAGSGVRATVPVARTGRC